jgi:uncharacterized membrane protein
MNIKRIFGTILTILGIVGLIYAAVLFVNTSEGMRNIKILATYGTLGLVFFISGINLVLTTKDES